MPYTTTVINGKKIVLDENGKPCRSCNSLQDFRMAFGAPAAATAPAAPAAAPASAPADWPATPAYRDDPIDSWELGNHTWNFLHTMAAAYPQEPTPQAQTQMRSFIESFAQFYPCQPCAEDFREYLTTHTPDVESRNALSFWFCDAHNAVNAKLGKPEFDCRYWTARWKDGWEDFKRASRK